MRWQNWDWSQENCEVTLRFTMCRENWRREKGFMIYEKGKGVSHIHAKRLKLIFKIVLRKSWVTLRFTMCKENHGMKKVVWLWLKKNEKVCLTFTQKGWSLCSRWCKENYGLHWGLQCAEKIVGMEKVVWFTKKEKVCLAFTRK